MQLDKLTMNLKAYIGIFTDSKLDGAIGESIKSLNTYFDALYKLDKEHKEAGKGASNLSAGIGTITDALALIGIASVLNLKKVKGMFDAVLVSVKGLTKGLNIYLLLFLAGLAAVQNLHKLSIGSHMSSDEIDAIYKENEAYHERQKEIAKAKEAIDKEHKALANLKTQMDTMALSDFNFKLKSINDTFKEGMKDVYGMGEALQSLTELQVKLSMPSMDKKFKENASKIMSFDRFEINGTTDEGIKDLADKKIRDKFNLQDSAHRKGILDRKTFLYETASYIKENYLFMSPTTEEDYYEETQRHIPKGKGDFKQESLKEIERLKKEKKKDDEYFINKMKEYVSLEGKRSPQNAENLKFAEYDKEKDITKKNKIAEENKWSSNDINRLMKDREKFVKQDTEIKAKQGEIKNELNKNISLFTKWGRTQTDFNTMISVMDKHAADMAKNTTAEYEQRVKVLDDMTKALSEISDKISEIQLKQAKSFMKLNNYKNLTDFKKGLDKVGLSSYKGLIKEFSGVIDSYASQGAKMDFMNGKFMDMAGAIQSFSNAQEKLKDNIKIVGAGEAIDSLGNKTGQSISQLYGRLSKMKGGIGGAQAAMEMNKYNSDTLAVLSKIVDAYGEIGEIDKLKEMEKTNARIQQKSLITAEKYKTNLDEQYISIQRINAGKLRGYELDKSMSDLSYQTTLNAKKADKSALEKIVGITYSDLIKKGSPTTIRLPKASFGNFARDVLDGTTEINLADVKQIESAVGKIDKFKINAPDSEVFNSASDIIDIIYKIDKINKEIVEATVKNIQETMVSDKARFEAQQEYFNNYLDYLSKSEQEITIMEYKKQMLLTQSELEKDANESLSLKVQALKLGDEISARTIENSKKLLEIEAERAKYAVKRQAYFGSDLVALQTEYDITKNLLNEEKIRLENKKKSFVTTTTDTSLNKQAMENLNKDIQDRKAELEKIPKGTTDKFEVEKATQLTREIEKQTSQYALLENISKMTGEEREEYLKNSVEYKTILKDIDKNSFDINEADLQNWKEKLRIEYELLDIAYDMKTIQSETEREKSRNLYKEVFGSQGFDEAESKSIIDKAKQAETTAVNKVEDIKKKALKAKFKETGIGLTDEDVETLLKDEAINKDIVSSLDDNIEAQKAIKEAQQAGLAVVKATNDEEKKRIQYLKEQVDTMLDMVDAISKGEGFKFNPSEAIKGASGALTKLYANSQEKDASKKQKLTGKDYADMAMAGVGLATNIIGQAYDSQMNVINAELSNLELRKQLARTEEEKQKIDLEILEKQKQQIDLQYAQSTQTMGVTGVGGSALGGALSGAAMGTAIMPGIGTAIGAGMGLLGGIMGGNSAKKAAEQQKKQLEAQLRANQYLDSLQKLQELNNELIRSVYANTESGIVQSMKDAIKEAYKTQEEKGSFSYSSNMNTANLNLTGTKWEKAFEILNGLTYIEYWEKNKANIQAFSPFIKTAEEMKDFGSSPYYNMSGILFKEAFNENIKEIQTSLKNLSFEDSTETLDDLKEKIMGLQAVLSLGGLNSLSEVYKLLDLWKAYANSIELVIKNKDKYYAQYFGFKVDESIDKKTGFITDVELGQWEKRTELLNNFVENSITGAEKISKSISSLVIDGFSNAFVRNNTQLNSMLDDLTRDIKYLSGSVFRDTAEAGTTGFSSGIVANISEVVMETVGLNSYQKHLNAKVQEFVNLWAAQGGNIQDVIDMMPEFTKTLQSAMQNAFGETDYTDRFNSIGSALKSTIETKLNEVSFTKLQDQFLATNTSLSALMSGDLTMNNMAQLSQGIAKYTAQAEQSAYKTKAMLDMLQLDQTVDYGVSNTQVEYKTGSTNTNVYNFNNTITTTIGNLLGDARAMQNFTDSIVGYMVESMQKQGVLKK